MFPGVFAKPELVDEDNDAAGDVILDLLVMLKPAGLCEDHPAIGTAKRYLEECGMSEEYHTIYPKGGGGAEHGLTEEEVSVANQLGLSYAEYASFKLQNPQATQLSPRPKENNRQP